jgi:hypothetical protein
VAYGLHLATRVQLALTGTRRCLEDRQSGALEIILATPVKDAELIRAHHQSLSQAFRGPLLVLLGINIVLQLTIIIFYEHLHMNQGAWAIFSVFFTGGALVTLADFTTLRWLSLCESLRRSTQLKAAGRAMGALVAGAWPGFALAWLLATRTNPAETVARIFGVWVLFRLLYDWVLIRFCVGWLRPGFRCRTAEAVT